MYILILEKNKQQQISFTVAQAFSYHKNPGTHSRL